MAGETTKITLFIGDRAYSSWSLRGFLLAELSGLRFGARLARMKTPEFAAMLAEIPPARTVPALLIEEGGAPALVWDSLAIAEELAQRAPDAGLWPESPAARAAARSMAAEMHSGFPVLRRLCPMNLRRRYEGWRPPTDEAEALAGEVARVLALWRLARGRWGAGGPFLFGARFTAADAVFAPVAARLATYRLADDDAGAAAYVEAVHGFAPFRQWRAMALADPHLADRYELDLPSGPLPGPAPLPARAVEGVAAVNETCPYSGRPVSPDSLAEIGGRVVGFCNTFCRDKSVADAGAWPKLAPLLG